MGSTRIPVTHHTGEFLLAISEELARADALHSDASDHYEMLAILGEEFGELQQAVLDYDYHGGSRDAILKECVQVGAMAAKTFRFIHLHLQAPRHLAPGAHTNAFSIASNADPQRPPDDGIGGP